MFAEKTGNNRAPLVPVLGHKTTDSVKIARSDILATDAICLFHAKCLPVCGVHHGISELMSPVKNLNPVIGYDLFG
jgi:hypothetical protein